MTASESIRRLVVPSVAPPAARSVVRALADTRGWAVVEHPVIGGQMVGDTFAGDVYVQCEPDVFGRVLDPPTGWRVLRVVDAALGRQVDDSAVEYGRTSTEALDVRGRLRELWKRLSQQRAVRPVLTRPAPFGLAFVAPRGINVPDDVTATAVDWSGLPDLMVVHDPSVSAWAAYDGGIGSPDLR